MYRQSEKKLVKQHYLLHMCPQYGELAAEIVSLVWGTPTNLNWFCVLAALLHGTLVVCDSQTAALNRGRQLCSAGRPSRWALAHILVFFCFSLVLLHVYKYNSRSRLPTWLVIELVGDKDQRVCTCSQPTSHRHNTDTSH